MIESKHPATWQSLEETAARILEEAGLKVERRKAVATVRGSSNMDLVFLDNGSTPPARVFIECKHWQSRVTKAQVHAFRTVVQDAGGDIGLLLSSRGFQSGAVEAAASTNVRLINWAQFEDLYEARWTDNYLRPSLKPAFEPLVDLTEPYSSKLLRKMEGLSNDATRRVIQFRDQFTTFAFFALHLYTPWRYRYPGFSAGKLPLPLRTSAPKEILNELPASILDIVSARAFGDAMIQEAASALCAIERVIKNEAKISQPRLRRK